MTTERIASESLWFESRDSWANWSQIDLAFSRSSLATDTGSVTEVGETLSVVTDSLLGLNYTKKSRVYQELCLKDLELFKELGQWR